jgi:ribonuclease HI
MKIYSDGSAHPNPGPGGYGVVILDDNDVLINCYSHQEQYTTNNIQELKAVLYTFLNYGVRQGTPPIVYCDSNYVVQTFTNWMFGWERKGWLKSDNQVPENLDLIKAYFSHYQKGYRIDLQKVKGHKGIKGNEYADLLATGKMSVEEVKQNYNK